MRKHIVILVDRSGSMEKIKSDTEGGIAAFLNDRAGDEDTIVSLYEFDNYHNDVYERTPVAEVPAYVLKPRGGTALLDAIGFTVARIEGDEEKTFVIATDGEENSSKEYGAREIKLLLEHKQSQDWKVVYIGANQDAFQVAQSLGVTRGGTMTYDSSPVATASAWRGVSGLYDRSSKGGDLEFTEEEREASQ